MIYRKLGKSDLNISEIGFGCMSLSIVNDDYNINLIHSAIDQGVNYFDTADLYDKGKNEEIVGKALKGKREKVVIATKVGNEWKANGSGWDWNPRKAYILKAVDSSLKRLQTDYIDLYQLHGGTIEDPVDETIEAFEMLKSNGKIRHYGISSIRPNVIKEYIKRSNIVSVMLQYSLLDRRPEEEVLRLLEENQIGVLARGSLAKGLLVNKSPEGYLDHSEEEIATISNYLKTIVAAERNVSELPLGYVLHSKAVSSAVVGIRTEEQLEDIVNAQRGLPLSQEEIEVLKRNIAQNYYTQHR